MIPFLDHKKYFHLLSAFCFIACGVILFYNVIDTFFLSDDFALIHAVQQNGAFGVWSDHNSRFFRPIISLSLFFDLKFWKLDPTGFHLTNIIVHSLNAFLISLIALTILETINVNQSRRQFLPLLPGFLFLILPIHSEPVTWIAGRVDVIATFFYLLSFFFYLQYKAYFRPSQILLSFAFFFFALLSKESVITLPIVILFYETYLYAIQKKQHDFIQIIYLPFIYFIVFIIYLVIRYVSIGAIIGGYGTEAHIVFNLLILARNFILYVARLFLPPLLSKKIVIITYFIFSLIILALAFSLQITGNLKTLWEKLNQTHKLLFFLTAAFIISLVPVISFGISAIDTQGERMLYLPSVFFSVGLIIFLYSLIRNQVYFWLLIIVLFIFYSIQLHITNKNWIIAGETSKSIVQSLKLIGNADRLFIMNLPDNINGAYILRYGLANAAKLFLNTSNIKSVIIISLHTIKSPNDSAKVTEKSNRYSIRLQSSNDLWMNMETPSSMAQINKTFKLTNCKQNGYDLTIQNLLKHDKLAYYSGSKLSQISINNKMNMHMKGAE